MGSFAYGADTRRRVLSALANLRNFQGNEQRALDYGLTGLKGPYRRMLNSRYGALPDAYAVGLGDAEYVVYCHGTPIAWVTNADGAVMDGDEPRVNFMPDWQYSPTTTYYQNLVRQAWGDKVRDPNSAETARARREKRDAANAQRRANRRAAVDRQAVTFERDDSAQAPRRAPNTTGSDFIAPTEDSQQATLARLLDPRLADPSWVPSSPVGEAAEERDWERVRSTQADRYPSHP